MMSIGRYIIHPDLIKWVINRWNTEVMQATAIRGIAVTTRHPIAFIRDLKDQNEDYFKHLHCIVNSEELKLISLDIFDKNEFIEARNKWIHEEIVNIFCKLDLK